MIDCIIVWLLFQVITAILFGATSGWIQMSVSGVTYIGEVTYTSCVVVQQIPDALTPPPPAGANIAHECGVSIDWFAMAVFIAYVIAMETRTGATLGDRATRIRVLDAAATDTSGVPLRKIMVRYLALWIGFVLAPLFATLLLLLLLSLFYVFYGDMHAFASGIWLILAAILGFGWMSVNVALIIGPLDPLYDRIAGTAVVRV